LAWNKSCNPALVCELERNYFGEHFYPMENTELTTPALVCDNCQAPIADEKFCSACGYPMQGTPQEKSSYRAEVQRARHWLKEADKKINEAKIVIYVLAGIMFIFGLIQGFAADDFPTMIACIIISILYLIFAAWSNTNPFGAILTSFVVYLTLQIIGAIADPATLFHGMLLKIIFIGAFIKGIRSAKEAQGYMRDLERFKGKSVGAP
jgi:hypothetical protein